MTWHPAGYERSVVEHLLDTQFESYLEKVRTTDCQSELRRLLSVGPPVYLSDPHALPLPQTPPTPTPDGGVGDGDTPTGGGDDTPTGGSGDTHVVAVWFAGDGTERSARLRGSVVGEERNQLWEELKRFVVVEGKEEGDDD